MGRTPETNKAERLRRRELMTNIAVARSAMRLPRARMKGMKLADLERLWMETLRAARDAGIIETVKEEENDETAWDQEH